MEPPGILGSVTDIPSAWNEARERVSALVRAAGPDEVEATVPACPDWSVRDLLAHVIGVDADALADTTDEAHGPEWTQGHVEERAGRDVGELLAEWDRLAPAVTDYLQDDPRPLGDLIIHEQDLRGALGIPGARDTPGLHQVRDQMLDRLGDAVIEESLDPLVLRATDTSFVWTSSPPSSDAVPDAGPGAIIEAPAFDLFRLATSRRTEQQVRAWTVAGDVGPYLDVLAGVGDLPAEELAE